MIPTALDTATIIGLIIQVLLPLLVGLVTKLSTHPGLKSLLLLVFTAANSYFVEWAGLLNTHTKFDWRGYLITVVINFVISVAVHYGLLKPSGATNVVQMSLVKDRTPPATPQRAA